MIAINYEAQIISRIATEFSKNMSAPINATAGGNGSYRFGYPKVIQELNIYYRRVDDIVGVQLR